MPNRTVNRQKNESCRLYDRFGVFFTRVEKGYEYLFRTWAPSAKELRLVGDFVGWERGRAMTACPDGVWECRLFVKEKLDGAYYKYKLTDAKGVHYCPDPFARETENGTGGASRVFTPTIQKTKGRFLEKNEGRCHKPPLSMPLSIYEVDLASFRTNGGKRTDEPYAALDYRTLAALLATHVKQMGYTHILLGETAFGSLFAPSARFGRAEDFQAFVAKLHANGIGVLYPIPLRAGEDAFSTYGLKSEEGYRETLTSTLVSALLYYTEAHSLDGFLLLGANDPAFGRLALDAIAMLQKAHPETILIAKDLAIPLPDGVYPFDKARENSLDAFFSCDPLYRRFHHEAVESLPTRLSILPRQNACRTSAMGALFGDYEGKFAANRLLEAYRAVLPILRLDRMGNELAPFELTDGKRELPWFMLDFRMHSLFYRFMRDLNAFYLAKKALWETNTSPDACRLLLSDAERNLLAIERRATSGKSLIGVFNFSGIALHDVALALPEGAYSAVFSTDQEAFGGEGITPLKTCRREKERIMLDLEPLSAVFIEEN